MAQENNTNNNSSQKPGESGFMKAQHKNQQTWERQSKKGANAMSGIKSDANGNAINNKQGEQK